MSGSTNAWWQKNLKVHNGQRHNVSPLLSLFIIITNHRSLLISICMILPKLQSNFISTSDSTHRVQSFSWKMSDLAAALYKRSSISRKFRRRLCAFIWTKTLQHSHCPLIICISPTSLAQDMWSFVYYYYYYYYYYFRLTVDFHVNLDQLVPPQVLFLYLGKRTSED